MGVDSYQKLLERGVVEVAPLAYMRGRTLSDSFIILDEAQNTTSEQMKMFLTRLGFHSKVVVTGDITQTDLPYGKKSGLAEAIEILKDIPEIGMVHLTHKDVVRHELVQTIVKAYDAYYHREAEGSARKSAPSGAEGVITTCVNAKTSRTTARFCATSPLGCTARARNARSFTPSARWCCWSCLPRRVHRSATA